jgi:hypothetical protein
METHMKTVEEINAQIKALKEEAKALLKAETEAKAEAEAKARIDDLQSEIAKLKSDPSVTKYIALSEELSKLAGKGGSKPKRESTGTRLRMTKAEAAEVKALVSSGKESAQARLEVLAKRTNHG